MHNLLIAKLSMQAMLTSCFSGARGSAFFNIERMITGSVPEMTYEISIIIQPRFVNVSEV